MTAEDYAAAGLYDPQAPNAAERLELLDWLAARGATLEQMQHAAREGSLTGLAGDLELGQGEHYTIDEVAELTGLSVDRLLELSLAVGLPLGRDARVLTEEHMQMYRFFAGGAALFGEQPLLRFLRNVGSSLSRIAEAGVSLFYVNIEGPMRAGGASERALAEASLRAIESIRRLQTMIHGLFRSHMEATIQRFRQAQLGRLVDTAHMTVAFVDLVGFTTLSSRMSARELATVIERFEQTAHDVVTTRGCRLVKLIGDEVMFVTLDAAAACDAALALCEEFAGDPSVTPRGALATGALLVRGGDYYGPVVNLASRVAQLAVPKELLVTEVVAAEARSNGLRFEPAGKRMLKGLDEPVALLTVERHDSSPVSVSANEGG
jgi:adenylate cyclase